MLLTHQTGASKQTQPHKQTEKRDGQVSSCLPTASSEFGPRSDERSCAGGCVPNLAEEKQNNLASSLSFMRKISRFAPSKYACTPYASSAMSQKKQTTTCEQPKPVDLWFYQHRYDTERGRIPQLQQGCGVVGSHFCPSP